jgi:hypothetical protein
MDAAAAVDLSAACQGVPSEVRLCGASVCTQLMYMHLTADYASPCDFSLGKNPKTKNAYFSTCTPSPALFQARGMAAAALSCAFTAVASR